MIIIEDHGESMIDGDLMTIIERKLKYISNRPHFLLVYRRDKPRGMLGEHEKSL